MNIFKFTQIIVDTFCQTIDGGDSCNLQSKLEPVTLKSLVIFCTAIAITKTRITFESFFSEKRLCNISALFQISISD